MSEWMEKEGDYEKMSEEKEVVMRNAMTTRAPGGANNEDTNSRVKKDLFSNN